MPIFRNLTLVVTLAAFLPGLSAADFERLSEVKARNGVVVSVSGPASEVGLEILKSGGNAVDAAVALEFALAVTWPEAGNIGGGGFMLVHPPDGREVVCIDYRETAPAASTETMFDTDSGRHTHKIVGVPGTVRGMALAHERFGKLEWKELVLPAARLAKDGFEVDEQLAESMNGVLKNPDLLAELTRVYGKPDGTAWNAGDTLKLPDLARTLRRIAERGASEFYEGETAKLLVDEMQRGNGIITLADLKSYRARVRPAVHGKFRGYDVYGPALPSSGGICLVEMLNVLEEFDLSEYGRYSARNLHVMAETMKRVYRDRALFLGDADFVEIPEKLTRKSYARKLADDIDLNFATPSETLAPDLDIAAESPSTTHFSVIDADGLAVSNTTTLEQSWGARIVVKGAGFLLNNEMGDFNWFPGHSDRKGNIGTKPNRIEPGKRMLSSQTPVIVGYKERPFLLTGSPGGRTIINTSMQMVLNVIEFEMDLPAAMKAARIHHQWLPDKLSYETHGDYITDEVEEKLKEKGHVLAPRSESSHQGDAHSISVDPDTGGYHGVADWRRDGVALGY